MDGNGRWAKERGKNRLFGHKAGIEAVRETIRCAFGRGRALPDHLLVLRPRTGSGRRTRSSASMNLFATTMLAEVDGLHEEHVRVMTIGAHRRSLPEEDARRVREGVGEDEGQRRHDAGRGRELRRPGGAARRRAAPAWTSAHAALRDGPHARGADRGVVRHGTFTRPTSPTPTCSSARAARCACRTSCCGRSPMPSSCAPTCCGRDFDRYELPARAFGVPGARPPFRGGVTVGGSDP